MNQFRVVAVAKNNKARLVMPRKGRVSTRSTPFTVWRSLASDQSGWLDAREAAAAVRWVRGRGWQAKLRRGHGADYPFVEAMPGVVLPGDRPLMRKLNRLGRERKRLVLVRSGFRGDFEQWQLRMLDLRGLGNTAARCCVKYWDQVHSWAECGKQSQSNHSRPPAGTAADCGLLLKGGYRSIGLCGSKVRRLMARLGLCLPVPGEAWHCEVGSVWRA